MNGGPAQVPASTRHTDEFAIAFLDKPPVQQQQKKLETVLPLEEIARKKLQTKASQQVTDTLSNDKIAGKYQ